MTPNFCVLIPTYNHCRTLARVVRDCAGYHPVIVVDDGSTDATSSILTELGRELTNLTVVTHPHNQGKGSALRSGFHHAKSAGFSHAITIDSDGQHLAEDIPRFESAVADNPSALILGHRDLVKAGAGRGSRFGCAVSNFWTWVETGQRLPDTQTGFRCYPLDTICLIALDRTSYAFEIEVLVKASWTGVPIQSVPIQVRYFEGQDRVSHMRPVLEFLRISWLNTALCTQRSCFPQPYLGQRCLRRFRALPLVDRLKQSFVEVFVHEPGTPGRIAASIGLGLFLGISPFWGFQIVLAIVISHLLGLSKAITVVASNISFPLMVPPILYGSLVLGRLALGDQAEVDHWSTLELAPADFWPYVLGSLLLASAAALVGGATSYLLLRSLKAREGPATSVPGRARTLVLAFGLCLVGALLAGRLKINNDVTRLLPDSSPSLQRATTALTHLMDRTLVDIGAGTSSLSDAQLGEVADEFAERILATGHVESARSRIDASRLLPLITLIRENAALLTAKDQYPAIQAATEPDKVISSVQHLAERIQEPDGAALKDRAAIDPLGITDHLLLPLSSFADQFRGARVRDQRITSGDGRHILVPVIAGFPAADSDRSARYIRDLESIITDLTSRPHNRGIQVRYLGAHRATLDNVDQIRRDVTLTSSIGIAVVALLAVLCFGRFWIALLALTPALFGSIIACGSISLLQNDIAGAVLGFGIVLVGLTIDFAVHVLFRIDRSPGDGHYHLPIRALLMGGTTTSLAFVALQGSSLPFVREVGLFGSIGILAAMLFAVLVLPKTLAVRRSARPILDLEQVIAKASRHRRSATWIAIAATPLIAVGAWSLKVDGDPTNLSGMSQAASEDEAGIFATWGKSNDMSTLVVEGATIEEALATNDQLALRLDGYRQDGLIRTHGSIARLLPSEATQRERRSAWQDFWDQDRRESLHATLRAATDASPFRTEAFAPFESMISTPPALLRFTDQQDGPMSDLLDGRVYHEGSVWHVMTPVFTDRATQTEAFAVELARDMPAVTLLNKRVFSVQLASMVTSEIGLLAALAFLMVSVVVFLWHGRALITAAIVSPLLLSLVWTLGILGWLGVPISLANAIFVVFLFGIAVDYSIFLSSSHLEKFRDGVDRTRESQSSVLLCTLTTCGGFGSLALAGHPAMHSIGVTALAGLVSSAITTQLFVPLMSRALLRRAGPNGTPRVANLIGGFWALLVLGGGGVRHLLLRDRKGTELEKQTRAIDAIRKMARRLVNTMVCGKRELRDIDRLTDRPCILVANHESMYDLISILSLERPIRVLVKDWVWNAPVMGSMIRTAGYIRAGPDPQEIFQQVSDAITDGHSVLVFPEGRRSRDGKMGRFHNGAFAMARRMGVEVQPLAMINSRSVVPYKTWWIGDHHAVMAGLAPMNPSDYAGDGGDRRMARACRDTIRARVSELWITTQYGPSWHHELGGMYRYFGPLVSHYATWKCRLDPMIRSLPTLCPPRGRVLVAGSGFGLMAARLALACPGLEITCVDIDRHKLRYAQAALGGDFPVKYIEGDIRDLPTTQYDFVLAVDVLHYWDNATQRELLRCLTDRLAPGQKMVFRECCTHAQGRPSSVTILEHLAILSRFTQKHDKLMFRSEQEWQQLLAQAGLDIESSHPDLGKGSNLVLVCRRAPLPESQAVPQQLSGSNT